MFFWDWVDGLWATKGEDVGLIVRAIIRPLFATSAEYKKEDKKTHTQY